MKQKLVESERSKVTKFLKVLVKIGSFVFLKNRSSRPEVFSKNITLKNFAKFTGMHLCQGLFFNKFAGLGSGVYNFIKKETLAQVFSCKFCEIFKNTFLCRTSPVAASWKFSQKWKIQIHDHVNDWKNLNLHLRNRLRNIGPLEQEHWLATFELGCKKIKLGPQNNEPFG